MSQGTARSGLDWIERTLVCVTVFCLVAFNGRPLALSSGLVCLATVAALTVHGLKNRGAVIKLPKSSQHVALLLTLWVFLALVSTIGNLTGESAINFGFGYLIPYIFYIHLVGLNFSRADFASVLASMAVAVLIRFGYGAYVFVQDWGLPPLERILMAHFNVAAMRPYMDATFGSTSNTASFIAVLLAILMSSLASSSHSLALRMLISFACAILLFNLLITGSRSAIIMPLLVLTWASFRLKSRWRYGVIIILAVCTFMFSRTAGANIIDRFVAAVGLDTAGDNSVFERSESIRIGMDIMWAHPFGVGPGMSHHYNPYHVAHQFAVAQGGEVGVLGAVVVIILGLYIVVQALRYRPESKMAPEFAFRVGAVTWIVYAMTTNIPLNSSITIPWVGLLMVSLALAEKRTLMTFGVNARQGSGGRPQRLPARGSALVGSGLRSANG